MQEIVIRLRTIEEVRKFVKIVSQFEGEAIIKSGKYVIDAKSILAIFSLDLSKPLTLGLENAGEKEQAAIQEFIVR